MDKLRTFYDEMACQYDAKCQDQDFSLPKWISRHIPPNTRQCVLDLCCGTGLVGAIIKTYLEEQSTLTGVDMSSCMLKRAQDKQIYTTTYLDDVEHWMSMNHGQQFDIVVLTSCLHHFKNPISLLKNLHGSLDTRYLLVTIDSDVCDTRENAKDILRRAEWIIRECTTRKYCRRETPITVWMMLASPAQINRHL